MRMVSRALKEAEAQLDQLDDKERDLVELAKAYLEDTKYYYDKQDLATALATISYSEGLLDSLARLGKLKITWDRSPAKRVVAAGSFDIIHPGHIIMLREAARHGDELYVIVSRDKNAKSFKKRETVFPEESRRFIVDNLKPVKKAILGDPDDILKPVAELRPQVVFLGPDQNVSEEWVRKELEKRGLKNVRVLRMPERVSVYKPSSSSQVIKNIVRMFCYQNQLEEQRKPP